MLDLFDTLASTPEERAHPASRLATVSGCDPATVERYFNKLRALGQARLGPAPSVLYALKSLRSKGVRLGVLSDASAEIAAAWPRSPLATLVDTAVFSCQTGTVKADQRLYGYICDEPHGALVAGMVVVAVRRRGPAGALAFGDTGWSGPSRDSAEHLPAYLVELS